MEAAYFKNDDATYEQWLRDHPEGHVFNHFGGSDESLNVVHKASCRHLSRIEHQGARTAVEKVCALNYFDLLDEIRKIRGESGWTQCSACR